MTTFGDGVLEEAKKLERPLKQVLIQADGHLHREEAWAGMSPQSHVHRGKARRGHSEKAAPAPGPLDLTSSPGTVRGKQSSPV